MKTLHLVLIPAGMLLLTGCMTAKPSQSDFYTPTNWDQPIESQAKQEPGFFPRKQNYGNSPKVSPMAPMQAQESFTPDFKSSAKPEMAESTDFEPAFSPSASKAAVASSNEQMEGRGSWYGPGFHGKQTANGERYNQRGMTAAHKILPMGTWVRVTNQDNGKSVVVRINDRGPYKKDRIIDLTKTAAQRLDYAKKGTAPVKLEVVRFPDNYDPSKGLTPYKQVVIQVAVFSTENKASQYKQRLKSRYNSIPFMVDRNNGNFYVVAGPYDARDSAGSISRELKQEGLNNFVRSFRK